MTGHFVFVLKGWLTFRFAGVGSRSRFGPAAACRNRPGWQHNVVGAADDLEIIEINMPATYGTVDLAGPDGGADGS